MEADINIGNASDIKLPENIRKSGRPRAIPANLEHVVVELYRRGYGYRAISNNLCDEHNISAHYSTVRSLLKRLGVLRARN